MARLADKMETKFLSRKFRKEDFVDIISSKDEYASKKAFKILFEYGIQCEKQMLNEHSNWTIVCDVEKIKENFVLHYDYIFHFEDKEDNKIIVISDAVYWFNQNMLYNRNDSGPSVQEIGKNYWYKDNLAHRIGGPSFQKVKWTPADDRYHIGGERYFSKEKYEKDMLKYKLKIIKG